MNPLNYERPLVQTLFPGGVNLVQLVRPKTRHLGNVQTSNVFVFICWSRHTASTSMYSLTFRVRVMLP